MAPAPCPVHQASLGGRRLTVRACAQPGDRADHAASWRRARRETRPGEALIRVAAGAQRRGRGGWSAASGCAARRGPRGARRARRVRWRALTPASAARTARQIARSTPPPPRPARCSDLHKASGRASASVNMVLGLDNSEDAWRVIDNKVGRGRRF